MPCAREGVRLHVIFKIVLKNYSDFHNHSFVKKLNMNNLPYSLTITMIINKQVLITFTVTLKTKRYFPIHKNIGTANFC